MPFKMKIKNEIFDSHDKVGIKLLMKLGLGFSHLHDYKFRHCILNFTYIPLELFSILHRALYMTMHSFFLQ